MKRLNNEILGKGEFAIVNGRLVARCGGSPVGSPSQKQWAKAMASRLRRLDDKRIVALELSAAPRGESSSPDVGDVGDEP